MLDPKYGRFWNEVQTDLYTDDDGRVFGVENDLCNNHVTFYIRYPDGGEVPIITDDVFKAIEVFNHKFGCPVCPKFDKNECDKEPGCSLEEIITSLPGSQVVDI